VQPRPQQRPSGRRASDSPPRGSRPAGREWRGRAGRSGRKMSPAPGAGLGSQCRARRAVCGGGRRLGFARARVRGGEDRDRQVGDRLVAGVRHREGQVGVLSELLLTREVRADDLDWEVARWLVRVLALAAPAGGDARSGEGDEEPDPQAVAHPLGTGCPGALLQRRGQHTTHPTPALPASYQQFRGILALARRDGCRWRTALPSHNLPGASPARRAGPRPSKGGSGGEQWSDP
jgi:hypothetical protein